ncbi:SulP family inorganic anion transporter [Parashewanella spongiae]|uniref:SulP family inorganic anion transporter n=1 Tax=Parashewanella spongiae TaxID=342950 RepID=A0A3A6UAS5_9GAMM|nr:SulP family inorganic anion transporter [Parashewanella spongiae]MCL1080042.1 SulP family inorganic anion transporter [Parashewanella spongiae]RJY18659.1 SulP family inorganic anion transporter [Parashewanella spongiae]
MFDLIRHKTASSKADLLSGITVALALVPEAVAFAFVAGVEPMVGLYAAFIMGLITALIGGRPGMISGATGAMAVVMVALVAEHGVQYLFAAVVLAGLIQVLAGVFKLGKFIRIVPYPVMIGFVNGLAIVIFLAQLGQFKAPDANGVLQWLQGNQMYLMLGLVALTMFIIHFLPKLTSAIPSSLAAILTVTAIVVGFDLDTRTVLDFLKSMSGDETATIAGNLPTFNIPSVPFNLETLMIIAPYSAILAAVGLIESLLTLTVIDEMTESRGKGNKECVGQGVANITSGFFGAMGGCAMIGQSMININSGGRGRLSGITAALALLAFILFGSSFIEMIPLAALVGVMFMVVLGTFEWASFKVMRKVPLHDAFVIILVTTVTVFTDLAFAVFVGVIVSALVFAWEHAKHINVQIEEDANGWKVYKLNGPLFFGSVSNFLELFDAKKDSADVIVDFQNSRVADHSALEAIDTLAERYVSTGKRLHLRHLSGDCKQLLNKAGDLVEVNLIEDPHYHIADDKLDS